MRVHRLRRRAVLAVALTALALPASAAARDASVTSFDGTIIQLHFFPAADLEVGAKAPTVLVGPGWSSPGDKDPESKTSTEAGVVGIGPLRHAGMNVLTWDPRGFGTSGGSASVDSADAEGRDVEALIDYVAQQPETLLDSVGDPRLGMAGGSYGGGIQLVTAAIDKRVDAIVPDIAWHSLTTSLYQDNTFKSGWGTLLYLTGKVAGHLDPHIDAAFSAGSASGRISAADAAWFASRGPGDELISKIRIPTLLIQGTVDTLFPLDEAVANYRRLRKTSGAAVKMLWFCGGHGACLTNPGDTSLIESRSLAWFKRYLFGIKSVSTGPGFQWVDQKGMERTSPSYPPPARKPLTATGSGTLALLAAGGSGPTVPPAGADPIAAASAVANGTRAANAVNVKVRGPKTAALVVGAPTVTLHYTGTALNPDTRVFGQVVDDSTNVVLGNLVTPIPLVLDGQPHTVTRPLELISGTLDPGKSFTVQIAAATTAYQATGGLFNTGSVTFSAVDVSLPTVGGSVIKGRLKLVRARRISPRHFRVRLRSLTGQLREVKIVVRSRSGKRLGGRTLARLGSKARTVDIHLSRRAGSHAKVFVTAKQA